MNHLCTLGTFVSAHILDLVKKVIDFHCQRKHFVFAINRFYKTLELRIQLRLLPPGDFDGVCFFWDAGVTNIEVIKKYEINASKVVRGQNVPGAIKSICEKDAALVKSEASAKKKATLKRAPKAEVKEISKKKSAAVKKAPAVKKPAVDKAKSAAVKIAPVEKVPVAVKKAPPVKKSVVDKTKSATIKKAPAVKKSVVDKTKSAAIKKAPAVKKSAVDKTKSASVKIAPTTKKLVVLKKQSAALEKLPIVKKPTAPARKKLQALEKPTVVKKQKQKLGKDSVVEIIAAGVDPNSIAGRIKLTARKRTPTSPFTYARASEISVNCLKNVPLLTGVESEKRKVDQMWLETKKSLSLVKSFSKRSKQASAEQYEQFSDQYEFLQRDAWFCENVAIKVISLEF
uniref:Uncharacterized protein n=1 Tax=Ditylenchus dipsaci TaxID=166011 RepID=A0A915CRX1_9BILA